MSEFKIDGREFRNVLSQEIMDDVKPYDSQIGQFFGDMANSMGFNPHKAGYHVGKTITTQHRTLQGTIVNWLFGIIKAIGEQEYTDARNEVAVNACKRVTAMLEEEGGYQPFI